MSIGMVTVTMSVSTRVWLDMQKQDPEAVLLREQAWTELEWSLWAKVGQGLFDERSRRISSIRKIEPPAPGMPLGYAWFRIEATVLLLNASVAHIGEYVVSEAIQVTPWMRLRSSVETAEEILDPDQRGVYVASKSFVFIRAWGCWRCVHE